MTEVEIRSVQVADVDFPRRRIDLIVMPYEQPTRVSYRGRMITEVCSQGAYSGVECRTRQIRVNLEHRLDDVSRLVGKAVALHPSRTEGLVAEIGIFKEAPLGDFALELADAGVLDASAGFTLLHKEGRPVQGAEVWESRDVRRLNKLYLDHVALTTEAAYPGAKILAVRTAPEPLSAAETVEARPNLDQLRFDEHAAVAAAIDKRYCLDR